jgi:hypothetical protein
MRLSIAPYASAGVDGNGSASRYGLLCPGYSLLDRHSQPICADGLDLIRMNKSESIDPVFASKAH